MRLVGAILAVSGAVIVIGYAVYYFFTDFFTNEAIPIAIRVAVPAVAVGLLLLLISIGRERYLASKKETFREIEK